MGALYLLIMHKVFDVLIWVADLLFSRRARARFFKRLARFFILLGHGCHTLAEHGVDRG